MGRQRKPILVEVKREVLERVANVLGSLSGAGKCLADADDYDGKVTFYHDKNNDAWVLKKEPKTMLGL